MGNEYFWVCVFSFSFGGWVHYDNHKADYYGIEIRESRLDEFENFSTKKNFTHQID